MSFAAHMLHTCTIERATRAYDAANQPVDTWATHLRNVPCRFVEKQEAVINQATQERTYETRYLLLLPAGTDVRTDATGAVADRVTSIVHRDGTIEAGAFTIASIAHRRGSGPVRHISATLEQVRA